MTACPRCASTLVYRNEDSEPECFACGAIHHGPATRISPQRLNQPAHHIPRKERRTWPKKVSA